MKSTDLPPLPSADLARLQAEWREFRRVTIRALLMIVRWLERQEREQEDKENAEITG